MGIKRYDLWIIALLIATAAACVRVERIKEECPVLDIMSTPTPSPSPTPWPEEEEIETIVVKADCSAVELENQRLKEETDLWRSRYTDYRCPDCSCDYSE